VFLECFFKSTEGVFFLSFLALLPMCQYGVARTIPVTVHFLDTHTGLFKGWALAWVADIHLAAGGKRILKNNRAEILVILLLWITFIAVNAEAALDHCGELV